MGLICVFEVMGVPLSVVLLLRGSIRCHLLFKVFATTTLVSDNISLLLLLTQQQLLLLRSLPSFKTDRVLSKQVRAP